MKGAVFILANFVLIIVAGQPEGWRMVDRFHGFRYELTGNVQEPGFRQAIQSAAENDFGCFGWVQNTDRGTVVGEARCNKRRGPEFQAWLSQGPSGFQVEGVTFKDYEDTKIKLHFSHFKILEDTRKTCFRDEPHQCEEFKKEEDEVLQESSVHSEL
ncbi:unnamed protein product [Heterosigma akashiwo]|mmetsp:Transcript_43411/g.71924  ORF Transcript_43411/g.71924 Transcript_43411/m.71924 type:complete len:157 (-) Transcript_43411:232-702(-)